MFYQSDFRTLPARFQPRYDYRRSFGNLRKSQVKVNVITPSGKVTKDEIAEEEDANFLRKWFFNFCDNTSVHGMKYIGQMNLHWTERWRKSLSYFFLVQWKSFRAIWSLLVSSAVIGVVYISLQLSQKFSNSPLSTVVESTIFPVAEIAYPAITM